MNRKIAIRIGLVGVMLSLGLHGVSSSGANTDDPASLESKPYPEDLLQRIRQAATMVPVELAVSIKYVKLPESHPT